MAKQKPITEHLSPARVRHSGVPWASLPMDPSRFSAPIVIDHNDDYILDGDWKLVVDGESLEPKQFFDGAAAPCEQANAVVAKLRDELHKNSYLNARRHP